MRKIMEIVKSIDMELTTAQNFRLKQPDKYRRKLDLHNERKRLIKKGQWPKQIEKKNCTVCTNPFIPKSHNAKCCGDGCKKINRKLKSNSYGKVKRKKETIVRAKIIKACSFCSNQFVAKNHHHNICSNKECKRIGHLLSTYKSMSGNWGKYLKSLCRKREDEKRSKLFTVDELMQVLIKQDYKCALSGTQLSCKMELDPNFVGKGKRHLWPTNVSIDRINSTKGYTIDNVQLVCVVLNVAKSNLPQNDYIEWCNKVAEYNKKED